MIDKKLKYKNIKDQKHMLAYITPSEAKQLEKLGGQKTMTKEGIPAYPPSDNYGGTHGSGNNNDNDSDNDNFNDFTGADFGFVASQPETTPTNTTTNNDSDFDPFGHSRFDVGSGYYGEPVTSDLDETTIDESTTTFAPTVTKPPSIWEGIKTIGKNLVKGYVAAQTFGALGLSPKAVQIGNVALGFGKQIGLTKSGSINEFGLNTANSIGDMFGDRNIGDMFSGNNKGNTSTSNINNDIGNGGDGEGLASLENQASSYDEYILLLQKLQSGNISDSERNRFNVLKNMLGI